MLNRAWFFLAVALLGFVLGPNGGGVPSAWAASGSALQTFDVDAVMCLAGDPVAVTVPAGLPLECPSENKAPGAVPGLALGIAMNPGERMGLVLIYTAGGWVVEASQDAIPSGPLLNGDIVGGVLAHTDLICDQAVDILAHASGPTVPATVRARTVLWGPGTGFGGTDESYLDEMLPPASLMSATARYRADIDTIWIAGNIGFALVTPAPLNSVVMHPVWSPTEAQVTAIVPWTGFGSPTADILCADSPQISTTTITGDARANPPDAGLYAAWVTLLSARDLNSGEQHFVYISNCKAMGTSYTDADADCLATVANAGGPEDANDADPDIDGDGLLDGIEVAWGTCPDSSFVFTTAAHGFDLDCSTVSNSYDTDGDGRTDLEEMIGPIQFLTAPVNFQVTSLAEDLSIGETDITVSDTTNIKVGHTIVIGSDEMDVIGKVTNTLTVDPWAGSPHSTNDPVLIKSDDTDGDGVDDGGLIVDANGDGAPDCPDENGDGTCDSGIGSNSDASGDGSSHVRVGVTIVGTDIEPDAAGADNCPNIANGLSEDNQVNTDFDSATEHGNGTLFGDACDADDDQDGIADGAEESFKYNAGAGQCGNDPVSPTPLDPLDPDTDGDGYLDGSECHLGSNPNDPSSVPSPMLGQDEDGDGLNLVYERFIRTRDFSGVSQSQWDVDGDGVHGDGDLDSDADGIVDQCEALVTGTHPLNVDTDGDGTPDYAEPGLKMRAWIGNGKGMETVDWTVPWRAAAQNLLVCSAPGTDFDGDGLDDAAEAAGTACFDAGGPTVVTDSIFPFDATYDDDGDGTMLNGIDDGPSWDTDGDGVLDGAECSLGTDPTVFGDKPDVAACGGTGDTDGDGLQDAWETCKWGTDPTIGGPTYDTDGDGTGDCQEAADVDGNGLVDFVGDVIAYAKAALLPNSLFGKDGDFDINGDGSVDFVGDVIQEAKFGLIPGLCK